MGSPTITNLRVPYWGVEATKGTGVAATERILAFDEMTFTPIDEIHQPNAARSYAIANATDPVAHQRGVDWSGSGGLIFEQFHTLCSMSVEGGVSATGTGTSRTWEFDRPVGTVPAIDAYTIERRLTDGSNNDDVEMNYSILRSWELSWGQSGQVDLSAEGFGRSLQSSTLTSISGTDDQPVVERNVAPRVSVFIDDTSSFGGSQVVCQVLAGTLRFNSGFAPLMTNDNRTSLDFCTHIFNPEATGFELSLTLLLSADNSSVGDYKVERAKAQAAAIRYVRLFFEGREIATGPSVLTSVALDMTCRHQTADVPAPGTQDGQDIVEYTFVPLLDGTTDWFTATVVNTRAAVADGTPAS